MVLISDQNLLNEPRFWLDSEIYFSFMLQNATNTLYGSIITDYDLGRTILPTAQK
jgi:hypothetical protein